MRQINRLLITLSFLLVPIFSLYAGKVTAKVIPAERSGKIEVGSKFYIEVEAENCQGEWKFPQTFSGARLLYTPSESTSSQITSVNGRTTTRSSSKLTFYLLATKAGNFSFGPVGMGSTSCMPVKYTIYEEGKGVRTSGSESRGSSPDNNTSAKPQQGDKPQFIGKGNENMFLRASVSKNSVFEQEAIVYTIKLYTTYQYIKFLGATAAPKFEGFVVEEQKITDANMKFENFNGRTYETAVVARYIIFPQKSGQLKITGNTYTVSADAFEYYNDPYFSQMAVKRPVQLNLTPNDLTVTVKSLPTPKPANFSGGVGVFSISSKLPQQIFKTNQASTITYTVTGQGNLKYIKLPEMNSLFPPELEVFSPESKADADAGSANVVGKVTFDYSFIPMETGRFEIPNVKLVYFNPKTGKYETAEARGYTINVEKGKASDKSQTVRRYLSQLLPVDVNNLSQPSQPYVKRFPFWLWYIVPFLLISTAMIVYRRYLKEHSDMESFRSKKAGKVAKRRLRKAMDCLRKNRKEAFYDEMLAALWGFLSDKLRMPNSELSRQNVSDVLSQHGIPMDEISQLIGILDDCEFAKYSPSMGSGQLQSVYDRGAEIIEKLNSDFKSNRQESDRAISDDNYENL